MADDLYVLIPGIMGSILTKDGHDVFGLTVSAGLAGLFSGGRSITDLRVDPTAPPGTRPDDGVVASRIAPDAHLVPGLWKIDGYGVVGDYLVKRLRTVPGDSYVEFAYDWRLDNRVAAQDLRDRIAVWLAARRQTHPNARVVLVAHSMGGLVARYYLEVLGGWRDARALVTFGTPYRGSLNALETLSNGLTKAFGLVDLSDLVRSFPSIHQLLPIYPCVVTADGSVRRVTEVAHQIPGLNVAAVTAARAFHTEIEDAVAANALLPEYQAARYRTHCVVGIEQPTGQSATVTGSGVAIQLTFPGPDLGGDGTVPRVSASPQEVDDDSEAMFAGAKHGSLQNTDAVLTQLRGWMTGVDLSAFRGGAVTWLRLGLADACPSGEPVPVTVEPTEAVGPLSYRLELLGGPTDRAVAPVTGTVSAKDGVREFELPAQEPGCYRLTVTGEDGVQPVSDLFVVAPR